MRFIARIINHTIGYVQMSLYAYFLFLTLIYDTIPKKKKLLQGVYEMKYKAKCIYIQIFLLNWFFNIRSTDKSVNSTQHNNSGD